jgi:hypothetical protein
MDVPHSRRSTSSSRSARLAASGINARRGELMPPNPLRRMISTRVGRTLTGLVFASVLLAAGSLTFSSLAAAHRAHEVVAASTLSSRGRHAPGHHAGRVTGEQCSAIAHCVVGYAFTSLSPNAGVQPGCRAGRACTATGAGFEISSIASGNRWTHETQIDIPVPASCSDGSTETRALSGGAVPVVHGHFSYSTGGFEPVSGEGQLTGNTAAGSHTISFQSSSGAACSGTVKWTAKVNCSGQYFRTPPCAMGPPSRRRPSRGRP